MSASIPILTFHSLDDSREIISFEPARFARWMRELREAGWVPISLAEIRERLVNGQSLPERRFALSFDDGYRSVHQHALPVLDELGIPATLFVCSGSSGPRRGARVPSMEGREMLSWRQVEELQGAGFDVESHGVSHRDLRRLDSRQLEVELRDSRDALQQFLGREVRGFSLPYGRGDDAVFRRVRELYSYCVTDRMAMLSARSDPHALPRIETFYFRGGRRRRWLTHPRARLGLGVLDTLRRVRRVLGPRP